MEQNELFKQVRKSKMLLHQTYFWTSSVKGWKKLFYNDDLKAILISSLSYLVSKRKVTVYAFVIMPNHIHVIWKLLDKNGKEMPHASFHKFTSHKILDYLKGYDTDLLRSMKVGEPERNYRIWNRDALAVLMDSKKKLEQKIAYIHNNPLQVQWNLAERPEKYGWSSASWYEAGIEKFDFVRDYRLDF